MKRLLLFVVLCCVCAAAMAAPHVVLVQNSGWMEPFYTDRSSPFKPLVAEVITAAALPGEQVLLASFNQSLPGAPSPRALAQLRAGENLRSGVQKALAGVAVGRKPGGAMADTDLGEALGAAAGRALGGRDGLVWLFTNNRNSPGNDPATAERNREFYAAIHDGGNIHAAVAFPLRMPVEGDAYATNGLMIYVFGVGKEGEAALRALLDSGRLARVLTERPARLKPLDRDLVRLVPRRVDGAPGVTLSTQGNVLVADIEPGTRTASAKIEWALENQAYPYIIKAGRLAARSTLGGQSIALPLSGNGARAIQGLAPTGVLPVSSQLPLPVAGVPGSWSMAGLSSAGSAQVLAGRLDLQMDGQVLELSPAFRQRMAALFPGDPMPDVFVPPASIKSSQAVLPLEVRVHFSAAPLMALIGAVLATLLAGGALVHFSTRVREVRLTVEGERRTLRARAGSAQPIYDQSGDVIAHLKTNLFGHELTAIREGTRVTLGH
jgi:hypothetical protein